MDHAELVQDLLWSTLIFLGIPTLILGVGLLVFYVLNSWGKSWRDLE